MPHKKVIPSQPRAGRPSKSLDWSKIDFYLEAGSTGTQVAANLGIHPNTLYERCAQEKKMTFTDYSQLKKSSGHSKILGKQYAKALQGDNSMLIWVGKQQLGQRDEIKTVQQFDGKLGNLLDVLMNVKSEEDFKKEDK